MATELDRLVDPAPAPGSPPAAPIIDRTRLSPHLQLSIFNRIDLAIDASGPDVTKATQTAIAKQAASDILELVAGYVDDREISMLSALNAAAFHVGKVQRSITERRK